MNGIMPHFRKRRRPGLFTIKDASDQLGVPYPTLHRWITESKVIPGPRVRSGGRRLYYRQQDVERLRAILTAGNENRPHDAR